MTITNDDLAVQLQQSMANAFMVGHSDGGNKDYRVEIRFGTLWEMQHCHTLLIALSDPTSRQSLIRQGLITPEQQSPRAARIPFHACEYFEETGENCVICDLPPLPKQQSSLDADERFRRDIYLLLQEAGGYNHPDRKVREAFDLATLGIAEGATRSPRVCGDCGHGQSVIRGRCVNDCQHKCVFPD